MIEILSSDEHQTRELGQRLGRWLRIGDVVLLHGDLGAGKTTLTQGIGHGLNVASPVQSPTFTLVLEHEGTAASGEPVSLYHLDLYRLAGADDLDSFGFDDYLAPTDGVSVIEWPERAATRLPERYLLVRLVALAPGQRQVLIEAVPPNGSLADRLRSFAAPERG